MVKSQKIADLVSLYASILTDVVMWRFAGTEMPTEALNRDWLTISEACRTRGLPVLLEDAPEAGKHLLRCLAAGSLLVPSKPSIWTGGMSEHSVPTLFGWLWRECFDDSGSVRHDDRCRSAIRDLRQLLCCFKKVDEPCSDEATESEILSFRDVDRSLPAPSSFWEEETVEVRSGRLVGVAPFLWSIDIVDRAVQLQFEGKPFFGSDERIVHCLRVLDEVSGRVMSALGPYDWHEWSFRHGPGRVADRRPDEFKYSFAYWSKRLDSAFAYDEAAFANLGCWAEVACSGKTASDREIASVLRAVPKDITKPRLIAFESAANMWCQQNMLDYMSSRTKVTWLGEYIHFEDQSLNQRLARKGATDGTLATVDLSAASDRVTCTVVESWARSNPTFLCSLRACRTRRCDLGLGDENGATHDSLLDLRKYATMGNATTFPVQSLLFLSIALASVAIARNATTCEVITGSVGEVAVFGDDIVVPVDCREAFEAIMDLLWFKINADKTFWTSKFRESCGTDAYDGEDVTPAYVRSLRNADPEDIASLVDQSNNFYSKGLVRAAEFLAARCGRRMPLRTMSSGAWGLACRTGSDLSAFKKRWNRYLQFDEVLVPTYSARSMRPIRVPDNSCLLQYFTERPDPTVEWESGIKRRPILSLEMGWRPISEF